MQTIDYFFRQAWRSIAGLPAEQPKPLRPDLPTLRASQWNRRFERLMRNRLVMGAFRYGTFAEQGRTRYNNPDGIVRHLQAYRETGNAEHLVDIANLALVEFTLPSHQEYHWEAIDDGDHHTKRIEP
jgi:hypothetical protein